MQRERLHRGMLAGLVCLTSMTVLADDPARNKGGAPDAPPIEVEVLTRGVSSRTAEGDAKTRLPMRHLSPEESRRVQQIVGRRSMFRRLPNIQIDADPAVYRYFTHNPETAISIWRRLGISKFKMKQTAPGIWHADAGDGSIGTIEVLHRSNSEHLLLCTGSYKSPLLTKPIQAKALMHLRNVGVVAADDPDGPAQVLHDLDLFVMFPSQTVDTVARAISPVSHMIADRNFRELSMFVRFMHVAMQRQPGWVEQLTGQLDGVTPDQRAELLKVSAEVFVAAHRRSVRGQNPGVTQTGLESAVAPYRAVVPASGQ